MNSSLENNEEQELELTEKLKLVSPDDFVSFFTEKNLTPLHCPICNGTSMTFPLIAGEITMSPQGGETKEYLVASRAVLDSDPASVTSYQYRIICKNCTYEMAFNSNLLINWVIERKKGASDNG